MGKEIGKNGGPGKQGVDSKRGSKEWKVFRAWPGVDKREGGWCRSSDCKGGKELDINIIIIY